MKETHWISAAIIGLTLLTLRGTAQTFVDLGTASSFGVLAGTVVANTGATVINGDLGVSPGATAVGFPPGVVNGTLYIGNTTLAAQAQADLAVAYGLAAGQAATQSGVTTLANTTLLPGVYNSAAALGISGTLTLDGNGAVNPVFIFQMGSTLTTGVSSQILLIGGATAENIFWQVGSSATLGTSSVFAGNILANASITATTGVTIDGRLLAMNGSITLDTDTVTVPAGAIPEPADIALLIAGAIGLSIGGRRIHGRHARLRA